MGRRGSHPEAAPSMGPKASARGVAVELRGISKSFFGVAANDRVDLDVQWGEVHAILGENGAGKTTLCSILAGLYRPDQGEILVQGRSVNFRSPRDAQDAGIGMVYQHFRLVRSLTVAENLLLGHPDTRFRLSRRYLDRTGAEIVARYKLAVDPNARIWQLSVGEQQRVEILKLLFRRARVLILDEPTAVLTPQERASLFASVRALVAEGRAVILVSHKLDEVLDVADRITVLRHGRRTGVVRARDADRGSLIRMMVGTDIRQSRRGPRPKDPEAVLTVRGLRVRSDRGFDALQGLDLTVHAGEIHGIAGVAGNGQPELAAALAGLRPVSAGVVELGRTDITHAGVLERIRMGIAFVPEDRLGVGLASGLTVEENLALKSYRRSPYSRGPLLSPSATRAAAHRLIAQFDVRGARPGLRTSLLSGGNLQRVLLAREIQERPRLLIAASPTRGLDVGATETVRQLILAQRAKGTGVLLLSEDLDELLALADTISVMLGGRIVGAVAADGANAQEIGALMSGWDPSGDQR
jgi:general nucleoside transport system ATP-binding protein